MHGNPQQKSKNPPSTRHTAELILILLLFLSVVGIALTDFSPKKGFWFWMAMTPVFCAASIAIDWSRSVQRGERGRLIRQQLIHWIGYLVAIGLVFVLNYTGRLNNADAGMVALLVLGFATFCAGISSNWRIAVVGVFLGIAVIATALLEEYLWAILIPLVLIVIGAFFWRRRKASRSQQAHVG